MADLSINVVTVAASNTAVLSKQYNAGAAITAGQLVYRDTNNKWQLMDANAAATGNNTNDERGVALHAANANQPLAVCLEDTNFTPGATITNAAVYIASANAGAIAAVGDLTTGWYPTVVMIGKSASTVVLKPFAGGTVSA